MNSSTDPVFVLSSGRTGTKFLAKLFDLAPGIVMRHEAFASLQIKLFSRCSVKDTCDRRSCTLPGTGEDEEYLKLLLDRIEAEVNALETLYLRLGESSSHVAAFARSLSRRFPGAFLVAPLRDPVSSLVSVIGRAKWTRWFGRDEGRCRYARGSRDEMVEYSFEDHWLLSWCDVWNEIREAAIAHRRDRVSIFALDGLDLPNAERLVRWAGLKVDPHMLADRFGWISRHSSFSGDEIRRSEVRSQALSKISSRVAEEVVSTLTLLVNSGLVRESPLGQVGALERTMRMAESELSDV